jgi:hypothetical protein
VLVLTGQEFDVPPFMVEAVAQGRGTIIRLPPSASPLARAGTVRRLAQRCDRVVLHSHPDDTVPVLAFARADAPPVAMFNHAHFSLALGFGVTDLVVNTCDYFRKISEQHRFARRTAGLVFLSGVTRPSDGELDKAAAKVALGVDPDRPVLLSVGGSTYYAPTATYDFFRAAREILRRNKEARFFLMGVQETHPMVPPDLKADPRFHLLGVVDDPVPYYRAADVFLESFPLPSLGAVTESVAHGEAFPVPVFGATEGILRLPQDPLFSYRYRPRDEEDYVAHVCDVLARLPEAREHAREMRASIMAIDAQWESQLAGLNRTIDGLAHDPVEIPKTKMIPSEDAHALAERSPLLVGRRIDLMLPFAHAIRGHALAALQGYIGYREAFERIKRRTTRGVRGRLHAARHRLAVERGAIVTGSSAGGRR